MVIRKTRTRNHVIADMSVHHLAYIAVACACVVEQTGADYGYDLTIFTFDDDGQCENGNIFVQLKATEQLPLDPATGEIRFRVSSRDILTWSMEVFPVYLVVFNAKAEACYAVYVQQYLFQAGISGAGLRSASVELRLPAVQVDLTTVRGWREDKNAILRRIGGLRHD